jgi:RNA polymerase sigma-70 factor (ECF subfamily)
MELNTVIEGCLRGNKISQSEMYRCYKKIVYATIKRYIKNDMDAEDILQNGFIKLYGCINQYDSKGSFEGWICRIFKNMSIDFLRQKKYSFEYCDNLDIPVIEDDNNEEKLNDITLVLETLPKSHKTAIIMYYYKDLTHKEISNRLNISVGTSKSNLHKAKNNIIKKLKNKVYG